MNTTCHPYTNPNFATSSKVKILNIYKCFAPIHHTMGVGHAQSRYLNCKEGNAKGRASDGSEVITKQIL